MPVDSTLVLDAGTVLVSVPPLFVQVLCGRCLTINTVKIAVHSAESCCTANTMTHTSIKQKVSVWAQ